MIFAFSGGTDRDPSAAAAETQEEEAETDSEEPAADISSPALARPDSPDSAPRTLEMSSDQLPSSSLQPTPPPKAGAKAMKLILGKFHFPSSQYPPWSGLTQGPITQMTPSVQADLGPLIRHPRQYGQLGIPPLWTPTSPMVWTDPGSYYDDPLQNLPSYLNQPGFPPC